MVLRRPKLNLEGTKSPQHQCSVDRDRIWHDTPGRPCCQKELRAQSVTVKRVFAESDATACAPAAAAKRPGGDHNK